MYIPISQDVKKFYVNIQGTSYPVNRMLLNTQEVTGVEVYGDYYSQYFTIESLEDDNVITFTKGSSGAANTYYANTGNGWTSYSDTQSWTLNTGDTVMFKATLTNTGWGGWTFGSTNTFDVYGNIMSLLYGDDFDGEDSLENFGSNTFNSIFRNSYIVNAMNLKLPALTLSDGCYSRMFQQCASLITTPSLPAVNLAQNCYLYMFGLCTSLSKAPLLPATTLANYCYSNMFELCTSLTTAPVLPATTLATNCYGNMFQGCTSLTTAPALPATTLADFCYIQMFDGCGSLTTAPELPATVLTLYCYTRMFNGCILLDEVVCLATDISARDCLSNWLNNTASSGTFYKDSTMNDFVVGTNVPSGWTIQDYN